MNIDDGLRNLGVLDERRLERIPTEWTVFIQISMFMNGPVLFVYDRSIDPERPQYIIPFHKATSWETVSQMQDGDAYFMSALNFESAFEQARTAFGGERNVSSQ